MLIKIKEYAIKANCTTAAIYAQIESGKIEVCSQQGRAGSFIDTVKYPPKKFRTRAPNKVKAK